MDFPQCQSDLLSLARGQRARSSFGAKLILKPEGKIY